jgi:hypothetical protein
MGKVASRCLNGCEGGKKEVGEENLEAISNPIYYVPKLENNSNNDNITLIKTANIKSNESEILKKFVEDYKCKIK